MARISDLAATTIPAESNVFPISDGQLTKKISLANLKTAIVKQATTRVLGSVIVGDGLAITDQGVLSVRNYSDYVLPPASADVLGGIRVGAGLTIDDTSILSVNYQLPTATTTIKGGVKIGTGVSVSVDGTISVSTANIAGGNLGDVPYQLGNNQTTLLPGNITTARKFLSQTGTGTASRAPIWTQIANVLPVGLRDNTIVNVSVATGFLPVEARDQTVRNISLIS